LTQVVPEDFGNLDTSFSEKVHLDRELEFGDIIEVALDFNSKSKQIIELIKLM
jgi:hypothetical protein